jgi:hypothetical protein
MNLNEQVDDFKYKIKFINTKNGLLK